MIIGGKMKKGKLKFISRLFLSMFDFRIYPFTQKEKLSTAILYFIKLTLFSSVILGIVFFCFLFNKSAEMVDEFEKTVPEFNIVDGRLETSTSYSGEIIEGLFMVVDGTKTSADISEIVAGLPDYSKFSTIALADKMYYVVKYDEETTQTLPTNNYDSLNTTNKSELVKEWKETNDSYSIKLVVLAVLVVSVFAGLLILRIWLLIIYVFTISIFSFMFGVRLRASGTIKFAIYASTVPTLIDTFALAVLGKIPSTVTFLEGIILFIYAFYGLRAIKIDELISSGSGKTPEERIRDAINRAQKEIDELNENIKNESEHLKNVINHKDNNGSEEQKNGTDIKDESDSSNNDEKKG
jgi:hypothetical protein